uniref:F-box domain-containing protein n=1 Tax=Mycena chlorophos TaxID=658473 RepID=A0ABQ0LE94_MYCCL|nr:predicted protein [Mycena chlorophos]
MDASTRAAYREELAIVDSRIDALKTQLAPLYANRARIRSALATHKYDVTTLPNEVIAEVFTHFLAPYPNPPKRGHRSKNSPTRLLGICRRWHDIALRTPQLWRSIRCNASRREDVTVAKSWLERSGTTLISFVCVLDTGGSPSAPFSREAALDAFFSQSGRWEHAVFEIHRVAQILPRLCSVPAALGGAVIDTPHLVQLAVVPISYGFDDEDLEPFPEIKFVEPVPPLRSLALLAMHCALPPAAWSQLASLNLMDIHLSELVVSLGHCTNLIWCKLILYGYGDVSALTGVAIRLPRLEVLSLDTFRAADELDEDVDCLSLFTTPALRLLELAVVFFHPVPGRLEPQIRALLARSRSGSSSGCPLRRVQLSGNHTIAEPQIAVCRAVFPDVEFHAPDTPESDVYSDEAWKKDRYWIDSDEWDSEYQRGEGSESEG